jgi:hypothetical protein
MVDRHPDPYGFTVKNPSSATMDEAGVKKEKVKKWRSAKVEKCGPATKSEKVALSKSRTCEKASTWPLAILQPTDRADFDQQRNGFLAPKET